jgi:N-acetylglutamate synthase-like GNAT family acetyltransferase
MPPLVEVCSSKHYDEVQHHIGEFCLDGRYSHKEEFLTLSINSKLVAFGRIREHQEVSEMCTLGVIENQRKKGYAKTLVNALMQKATQPIYLVCTIPSFFESLGFYICENYPEVIHDKLQYCNDSLSVKEKYVVMTNQQ